MATSGSFKERPANLVREPTVFLRLETSCVFADSPRERDLTPKETRDGVARLETSLVITSTPRFLATA